MQKILRKNFSNGHRFRKDKKIPPEYYGKASPNPINRLKFVKRLNKLNRPEY